MHVRDLLKFFHSYFGYFQNIIRLDDEPDVNRVVIYLAGPGLRRVDDR